MGLLTHDPRSIARDPVMRRPSTWYPLYWRWPSPSCRTKVPAGQAVLVSNLQHWHQVRFTPWTLASSHLEDPSALNHFYGKTGLFSVLVLTVPVDICECPYILSVCLLITICISNNHSCQPNTPLWEPCTVQLSFVWFLEVILPTANLQSPSDV